LSLVQCENCDGEWFKEERWVKLTDHPIVQGGVPWRVDSRRHYRCGECGESFDLSHLEEKASHFPNT
jgi:hypothetical protein